MENILNQEELINKALEFADRKFKEMGVGNHFKEVGDILKNEFHVEDSEVIVAGILHDTLEDTNTTFEELKEKFSERIANMVDEVSHPKKCTPEQKKEYYEKIKHISSGAKMIKLADFKSHLPKFIGAFTGEGDYHKKETDDRYVRSIRGFLEYCNDSGAKNIVAQLTNELEDYILGNKK